MLCWANQTWSGAWHGLTNQILVEQLYPGREDHEAHFQCVLRAFRDPRYLRVDGKPVFKIYCPTDLPDTRNTLGLWQDMAKAAGLPGIYFLATKPDSTWNPQEWGYDAAVNVPHLQRRRDWVPWDQPVTKLKNKLLDWRRRPTVTDYAGYIENIVVAEAPDWAIPCVLPNWDNTPRSGHRGLVLKGSTPERFGVQLRRALQRARKRQAADNFLFVKSWNEWAEGNHLEPGRLVGRSYLERLRLELDADAKANVAPR